MDGHTICQDQWKLPPVDVEIHDYESTLDLSTLYSLFLWSNWTVTWFGWTDTTVPMAPFTKAAFVSMLRCNMTRAPTTNRSLASKPAVMLQLLLSFASFSAVFFLFHLQRLHVSSTSSVHSNLCTSEVDD